jgi:hypothetical protein
VCGDFVGKGFARTFGTLFASNQLRVLVNGQDRAILINQA